MMDIGIRITSLEEDLRQAMLRSDTDLLDRLLSDDLVFTNHFGQVLSKRADLETHQSGLLKVTELQPSEQLVKVMGQVVVVSVRMKLAGRYDATAFAADLRYTRVWQETVGEWRVIAGHCSPVQG